MRTSAICMLAAAMAVGAENAADNPSRRDTHPAISEAATSTPSYEAGMGPKVYFDEGHHEVFVVNRWNGFRQRIEEPIRRDGYDVITFTSSFTRENLKQCDILVVAVPLAKANQYSEDWSFPHPSAFSRKEINELVLWIHEGGSLFLISEHQPIAGNVADLAYLLGAQMFDGTAASCQPDLDFKDEESNQIVFGAVIMDEWREYAQESNILFERYVPILSNPGTLGRHPIVQGRNRKEELKTVLTWGGSAFRTSKEWVPILTLNRAAVGVVSIRANFEGSDLQDHQLPLGGWLQAAARDLGKGRVVLQADWHPTSFNEQYTLNVMHWLSGLLDGEQ